MTHIARVKKSKATILPHCLRKRCQPFFKNDVSIWTQSVTNLSNFSCVWTDLIVFAYTFLPIRHGRMQPVKPLQ